MKNKISILFVLASLLYFAPCQAQYKPMVATIPTAIGNAPTGIDSVLSPGVTAVYLYVMPSTYAYKQMSIHVTARRVSSAMNGKILLEGSNDGINYIALSTADSAHIADGSGYQSADKFLVLTSGGTAYPDEGTAYRYLRVKCIQIAGDTAYVKAKFYGRQ